LRNRPFILFLALAVVFALISSHFIVRAVQSYEPVVKIDEPVRVAVAAEIIHPYGEIRHVRMVDYPKHLVPPNAVQDANELKGKSARTLLLPGDVIRKDHLVDLSTVNDTVAGLSLYQSQDLRAVPLSLPKGFEDIKAGDIINLIFYEEDKAVLLLENVRVLSVSEEAKVAFILLSHEESVTVAPRLDGTKFLMTYSPLYASAVPGSSLTASIGLQKESWNDKNNEKGDEVKTEFLTLSEEFAVGSAVYQIDALSWVVKGTSLFLDVQWSIRNKNDVPIHTEAVVFLKMSGQEYPLSWVQQSDLLKEALKFNSQFYVSDLETADFRSRNIKWEIIIECSSPAEAVGIFMFESSDVL